MRPSSSGKMWALSRSTTASGICISVRCGSDALMNVGIGSSRPAYGDDDNSGAWKLPDLWTHSPRPQVLGKRRERVSHSFHTRHRRRLSDKTVTYVAGHLLPRSPAAPGLSGSPIVPASAPPLIAMPTTASCPRVELVDLCPGGDAAGGCERRLVAPRTAPMAVRSVPCISPSVSTWVYGNSLQ